MINLIFGCAGSGKTAYMMEKIRESVQNKKRTYLLVPEQQVFTAESMLAELPYESNLYFEVISFSRLCDIVFDKYGSKCCTPVSSGAKNLIMWKTVKELHPVFLEYNKTSPDENLSELMLKTVDECKANSISSEGLDELIGAEQTRDISNKLHDISLVMSSFENNLGECLGEDALLSEDKLVRLEECLLHNDFFGGSDVYIDSFTDFTGIEHAIISRMMNQADNLYVSVYSKERGFRAQYTLSASHTIQRLTRDARESNREFGDIVLNGNTRTHSLQLKLLEKHLWDFTAKKSTLPYIPEEQSRDIEMVTCLNEYEETECAALKILSARKSGIKYSEMAFVLRNPEERSGIIDAVFSKYNIPYFLSEKTGLLATPLARFVLSSLRCISRNYRLDDVLTLLKTGLCGVEPIDADLFEEYCLTWNIQGKTFTEDAWSMNPNGYSTDMDDRAKGILESANRVRKQLIHPLENLKIKCRIADKDPTELSRALFSYMESHSINDRLSSLAELELALGNTKEAGEILRIYDYFLSALSSICRIMGNREMTVDDFLTSLRIMLGHTDIASVPSIGEYVTIGSAATLRVENIKLALVGEMCEGVFPALPKESGLICESDKETLSSLGITFKTRRDRLMSDELFYVYRAFTKPSEKLIVMTHSSSISGGAKTPSTPWRRLKTLFELSAEEFSASDIHKLADAKKALQDKETVDGHKAELFQKEFDSDEFISPEIVRSVFGDSLYLSKSRIQNFVRCPMLFWSQNVLDLRRRQTAQISFAQSGTLIHFVLENALKELRQPDGHLRYASSSDILGLTDKWVNSYIDMINCPRTSPLMFSFSKLRNMAYLMVKNVCEEFSQSEFKIHSFEQRISNMGNDCIKPLKISLDEIPHCPTVYLGGSADRVDVYEKDGMSYLRIIDYKTGSVSFDKENVVSGSDLQLPAYLFATASEENKQFFGSNHVVAGSALYVSAVESRGDISICRSGMILNEEEFLLATNKNLDYSFISNSAEKASSKKKLSECPELLDRGGMEEMKEILTDTIKNTGNQIFSGNIRRSPSPDSCRFCPVKNTCPVACRSKY